MMSAAGGGYVPPATSGRESFRAALIRWWQMSWVYRWFWPWLYWLPGGQE